MKNIIPILFAFIIFNTSCYKTEVIDINDPKELPNYTFTINSDTKQYFNFKNGSWWIYKDNVSGEKDCLYVTDNYNYFDLDKANFRKVNSLIKKETTNIFLKLHTPDTTIIYTTKIFGDSNNITTVVTDFFSKYEIKNTGSIFSLDTANFKITYFDNQIVDSLKYSNCILFNTKPLYSDSLYLLVSKNVGIIKYTHKYYSKLIRNISLLKYHIVQ